MDGWREGRKEGGWEVGREGGGKEGGKDEVLEVYGSK